MVAKIVQLDYTARIPVKLGVLFVPMENIKTMPVRQIVKRALQVSYTTCERRPQFFCVLNYRISIVIFVIVIIYYEIKLNVNMINDKRFLPPPTPNILLKKKKQKKNRQICA